MIELHTGQALLAISFELERADDPVKIVMWASANEDFTEGVGAFIRLNREKLVQLHTELSYYMQYMAEKGYK